MRGYYSDRPLHVDRQRDPHGNHAQAMSSFYSILAERRRCPKCERRCALSRPEGRPGRYFNRCRYCGFQRTGTEAYPTDESYPIERAAALASA